MDNTEMNEEDFKLIENRINHVWFAVCKLREEMKKNANG